MQLEHTGGCSRRGYTARLNFRSNAALQGDPKSTVAVLPCWSHPCWRDLAARTRAEGFSPSLKNLCFITSRFSRSLTQGAVRQGSGGSHPACGDSCWAMAGSQRALTNVRIMSSSAAKAHVGWQQAAVCHGLPCPAEPLQALVRAARQLLHDGRSAGGRQNGSLRRRFMSLGSELPSDPQAQVSSGIGIRPSTPPNPSCPTGPNGAGWATAPPVAAAFPPPRFLRCLLEFAACPMQHR